MTSIFSMIPGILSVIIVFGGLIFFHELGHFLVARWFGMGVQTFSLGFGKPLFSRRKGQTTYQVAAIPLGGFVALVGESPTAELPEGFTAKDSFSLRPAWQRACVIAAGAIFNLLLAVIICWGMVAVSGKKEMLPRVGTVIEQSAAQQAGLLANDLILAIDSNQISTWNDIPSLVQASDGRTMQLLVDRAGVQTTFAIQAMKNELTDILGEKHVAWAIGITPAGDIRTRDLPFFEAAKEGLEQTKNIVHLTWRVLTGLVKGSVPTDNLGGPVGIAKVIYDESDKGMSNILFLAAFISVNLGVLNLLPIPVLDGGHLMFLFFEIIFKKEVPLYIREKATMVGLALLLSLMLYATYNDVTRLAGFSDSATPKERTSVSSNATHP